MSASAAVIPVLAAERRRVSWRILTHHAKSFAWAARLLPAWCRHDAAALYAWCRRCDDAVDLAADAPEAARAVARLRAELDGVYAGAASEAADGVTVPVLDPVLAGFQDVVRRHRLPRVHADDLIEGMAMDIGSVCYRSYDELLVYCYRVAGTVGLMMAHVMGVRDARALQRAADLGMAMQLTNVCRDVAEDAARHRVYVPMELLGDGAPGAVAELLRRADALYRSGDRGLGALPGRCAAAIRAARLIYADIGRVIAGRGFDVSAAAGRAVVPRRRKLWLALRALAETCASRLLSRLTPGRAA